MKKVGKKKETVLTKYRIAALDLSPEIIAALKIAAVKAQMNVKVFIENMIKSNEAVKREMK